MLSLIHAMEKIQSLCPSWKTKQAEMRRSCLQTKASSRSVSKEARRTSNALLVSTHVSNAHGVQGGQLVDGYAVWVVSSGG